MNGSLGSSEEVPLQPLKANEDELASRIRANSGDEVLSQPKTGGLASNTASEASVTPLSNVRPAVSCTSLTEGRNKNSKSRPQFLRKHS